MPQITVQPNRMSRMVYGQYFDTLTSSEQPTIARIANAVGCIFTDDGQINGSALLLSKTLILVPKHCFPFEQGAIFFKYLNSFVEAFPFIDGENDPPPSFRSNFKILVKNAQELIPAPLSVKSSIGEEVQLNYHIDGKFYAYPSNPSTKASDAIGPDGTQEITVNGDDGGVRYSWDCKGVTGIHLGEQGVLTINEVYRVIEAISLSDKVGEIKWKALAVLADLEQDIIDMTMLEAVALPVYLQPDQIISEKRGLFRSHEVSREFTPLVLSARREMIIEHLEFIGKSFRRRNDFFDKMQGIVGTIYYIPSRKHKVARIKIESLPMGISNIVIRSNGQTIATVQVNDLITEWVGTKPDRISAITQYVIHQLWMCLQSLKDSNEAVVRRVLLFVPDLVID